MPTERQIAAQLKKENLELKRSIISEATSNVLNILHDSQLYDSRLWPKNGFIAGGYRGEEKPDTVTIGVNVVSGSDYKKVRFNIWGKPARVLKQRKQLALIFDQCLYEDFYFYAEYPEFLYELVYHDHGDKIMDMLDFKFTIQQ